MKTALLCFVLLILLQPAHAALGTTATFDDQGRLWIVSTEPDGKNAHVFVQRSDDRGGTWLPPIRVTSKAQPVSADGENRPKLAFGSRGELYVSWTSPTSEKFTGDIRFTRSLDGGKTWSEPGVVHRDRQLITHRFESMIVDRTGRVWMTWIDKRDLSIAKATNKEYSGAAIYYAYSDDRGTSWRGDFKLADDHTCECCRIALTLDAKGRAVAMWRHVFPPNERDHAFAILEPEGKDVAVERVTSDRWKIDACPHHGPSLAISEDGTRHAVWFNQVNGEGRAYYGRLTTSAPSGVQALPAGASHADVAVDGGKVAIVWKRFDGASTRVESWLSKDGGKHFTPGPSLKTDSDSDQPRVVSKEGTMLLVWRRAGGIAVADLTKTATDDIKPFTRNTMRAIEQQHAGSPFWVMLWDLECVYCMKSLGNVAAAQRQQPDLKVITIATDPIGAASELRERLAQLGVQSEAYAFAGAPEEALRFAIDPAWMGEKPRAYRYNANGSRTPISGVINTSELH